MNYSFEYVFGMGVSFFSLFIYWPESRCQSPRTESPTESLIEAGDLSRRGSRSIVYWASGSVWCSG
jgi:hypothetical protein